MIYNFDKSEMQKYLGRKWTHWLNWAWIQEMCPHTWWKTCKDAVYVIFIVFSYPLHLLFHFPLTRGKHKTKTRKSPYSPTLTQQLGLQHFFSNSIWFKYSFSNHSALCTLIPGTSIHMFIHILLEFREALGETDMWQVPINPVLECYALTAVWGYWARPAKVTWGCRCRCR